MNRRELEKKILDSYECPECDDYLKVGVLLSDEIERYVGKFKLIDPFDPNNLKPAAYELTIGDEYSLGGKRGHLYDESGKNKIIIPAFQVLIIKTRERVNLPRFLIARWNIRVGKAYEGLLWVGGPQVDPGYVGHLFCPIYNLSDKEVTLRLGEPIAVIDFVTTTPFNSVLSKRYDRPPKRVIFDDYEPEKLKSALYTEARERIEEVENEVAEFGTRLNTSIGIGIAIIAVLVTVLSMIVSSGQGVKETLPWWAFISVTFSLIAFIISISASGWARSRRSDAAIEQSFARLDNQVTLLIGLVVILIIGVLILLFT